MKNGDTLARIQKAFDKVTGQTGIIITPDMTMDEKLGINSFAYIQLICALEDEFDIEIENSALRSFKNVQLLIDYIEKA